MDEQTLCEFHSDVPRGITVVVIIIMAIIIIIIKSAEGLLHKVTFTNDRDYCSIGQGL